MLFYERNSSLTHRIVKRMVENNEIREISLLETISRNALRAWPPSSHAYLGARRESISEGKHTVVQELSVPCAPER